MTTKVSSAMQDLTDDYAFSGTVSGAGKVVQVVNTQSGETASGTTTYNNDDTIPQISELNAFSALDTIITPTNASNILLIQVILSTSNTVATAETEAMGLFQDSTAGALAAIQGASQAGATYRVPLALNHWMVAGTVSATTFKVAAASTAAGTIHFNGNAGRIFGGVMASSMTITEIAV